MYGNSVRFFEGRSNSFHCSILICIAPPPATPVQADQQDLFSHAAERTDTRIRSVARWYDQHDKLEDAIALSTKYRDRDELLFDAMLDRISKELVRREDLKKAESETP